MLNQGAVQDARELAELFKLFSVETRVHIVELLRGRALCVGALAARLGVSSAAISQHLRILRVAGLAAREHLGIVPEEANVYLDLSVWRNVMLMAELHGVPRARRVEAGRGLLERLGIAERSRQKARGLSKGLRQRLMLCSALVSGPEILFLDEPTSGLDVQSAHLIRRIVRELNREGLTVFLTTHNMAEAEEMCDRVAIINHGRIVAIDTPEQLRDAMKSSQYVEVSFAEGTPSTEDLAALLGVANVSTADGSRRLYSEEPGRLASEVVTRMGSLDIADIAPVLRRRPDPLGFRPGRVLPHLAQPADAGGLHRRAVLRRLPFPRSLARHGPVVTGERLSPQVSPPAEVSAGPSAPLSRSSTSRQTRLKRHAWMV